MRLKVCVDTNLLVSALICAHGNPRQILELAREQRIEGVVSVQTLRELARVLGYPRIAERYGVTESHAQAFVEGLQELATIAPGDLTVEAIADDPEDNHVLAAALETGCEVIVTGDQHLLTLGDYEGIRILTPRALAGEME